MYLFGSNDAGAYQIIHIDVLSGSVVEILTTRAGSFIFHDGKSPCLAGFSGIFHVSARGATCIASHEVYALYDTGDHVLMILKNDAGHLCLGAFEKESHNVKFGPEVPQNEFQAWLFIHVDDGQCLANNLEAGCSFLCARHLSGYSFTPLLPDSGLVVSEMQQLGNTYFALTTAPKGVSSQLFEIDLSRNELVHPPIAVRFPGTIFSHHGFLYIGLMRGIEFWS